MENSEFNFFHYFLAARKYVLDVSELERRSLNTRGKPYPHFNTSLEDYNRSFIQVFDGPLSSFLNERKQRFGFVSTLDVMGQGAFDDDHALDLQTAITLNEFRPKEQINDDTTRNCHVIAGNIFSGATWRRATNLLHAHNNSPLGYDLIILRPADAGWRDINIGSSDDEDGYAKHMECLIVRKALKLLHPAGGMALIQYIYGDWMNDLNSGKDFQLQTGPIIVHNQVQGQAACIVRNY
ncbi:hypothetical protein KC726_01605 [Candidatus Woesebacteria bacterium]|nr:hypothetical protein [Candidatus Woesebacteria bacterium]